MDSMPSIAVVGSGPSGCFTAQHLLKQWPGAEVTVFDKQPTPYGLLRYGVAADHQGTKGVTRQFDRLFTGAVRFVGNVTIGRDVSLAELRAAYDIVVLASGLGGDRRLGVPGDDMPGVIGSGRLTRCLNDHPDETAVLDELGSHLVVVGNGNVAIDVIRLLTKLPEEFDGSDLHHQTLARIRATPVRRIDIVGRSPLAQAKFDPTMVRELAHLTGIVVDVPDRAGLAALVEAGEPHALALQSLLEAPAPTVPVAEVAFHFGWTPLEVLGAERCSSIRFSATSPSGSGGGSTLTLNCDTVVTAIGFTALAGQGGDALVLDDVRESLCPEGSGHIGQDLYCTGWFHRSTGALPEIRLAARDTVARIVRDNAARTTPYRAAGSAALPEAALARATDFSGWRRIDEAEISAAPPGRTRQKIRDRAALLAHAQGAST